MEFECKSSLHPEWHKFVGTATENKFISDWFNRGWTTLKFEGNYPNPKTFFEIREVRKVEESPKCKHLNYESQIFALTTPTSTKTHYSRYICIDCGKTTTSLFKMHEED